MAIVHIVRSVVDQVRRRTEDGRIKTPVARSGCPDSGKLEEEATFKDEDWIFASDYHNGEKPLWPDVILKRIIRPAATAAGIMKNIGWHTFRRSFATLLSNSSGTSVKTLQDLMKHASPMLSLDTYAQSATEDKRAASDAVASMFQIVIVPKEQTRKSESLVSY